MDFGERRQQAIERVREQLRAAMPSDEILKHMWRVVNNKPKALEHWLFTLFPDDDPNEVRDAVAKKGRGAWHQSGTGADMDERGWNELQKVCQGKQPDYDTMCQYSAKNLHALLGAEAACELIDLAGSTMRLSRMTQRDVLELGNESGTFGGPQKTSVLKGHELSRSERALRVLASRTVLAARLDTYSDNFKGDSLRQEVLYAR